MSKKKNPDKLAGHCSDGEITVKIIDKGLKAEADFYPPIGEGNLLTIDRVENQLYSEGITIGIDTNTIANAVLECNTKRRIIKGIIVARGKLPVREVVSYIKIAKRLFTEQPKDSTKDQIDYKNISKIKIVKKNEVIGLVTPQRPGISGISVTAEEIPFSVKKVIQFIAGENTESKDNKIISQCNGMFILKENKFSVSKVLEIKGNVDFHTGHIRFPGDVILSGEVKDGFKIFCGGNLTAKNTLDVFHVIVKQNISATGGIIGKNNGFLQTGGSISAK